MHRFLIWVAAAWLLATPSSTAQAADPCGMLENPCEITDGRYYVATPEVGTPKGAILWLHGYGSSGAAAVRNKGFMQGFTKRGFMVVAPDGQGGVVNPDKFDWGVADGFDQPRDDLRFLQDVLGDAIERFSLRGKPVLAAGFSRGGSMVWDLACRVPGIASAYAAVSGAFWEPFPETCEAPVHLRHSHGFTDRLVPLEGRDAVWGGHKFTQGNVFTGLQIWRRVNGCMLAADDNRITDTVWHKAWSTCETGSLTLEVTPRGHGIPKGWTARTLDWFEGLPTPD